MHGIRRSPAARTLVAAALGLALAAAAAVAAESRRGSGSDRNTISRRTAGGGEFPTWEREVESEERSPLPEGRQGRFVPAWTFELGAEAAGVATAGATTLVVPLGDGSIRLVTRDGQDAGLVEGAGRATLPPVEAGALVLVAAGERVVAVGAEGEAWRSEAAARIVRPLAVAGDAAFVVREGGALQRLALRDGSREWSVSLRSEAVAGPSASHQWVVVGQGGDVVAYDARTGSEAFRVAVGARVDSVLVTPEALYASGMGVTGRSRDVTPVMAGWTLGPGGRPEGRPWRLRVGGACHAPPLPLDENVVLSCSDGYVRAVGRRRGVGGWKTDLPSASSASPVITGARLDYVIPQSRHAVALQAENGAVLGWVTLPDEDETFVGTAAGLGSLTATATSFRRLVAWSWEWSEESEGEDDEPYRRPGEDEEDARRSGGSFPILR